MAEEEDPWAFDEGDTVAETPATGGDAAAPAAGDTGATEGAAVEGGDAAAADGPTAAPPPEDDGYRKPVQLYKHWVRPKFLQYKYMYNYRTNYYDDVIDYLDQRNRGLNRDIPRAQTWAERVLRAGGSTKCSDYKQQRKDDTHLIQVIAASIKTHNYHTKAYINRKYSSIL